MKVNSRQVKSMVRSLATTRRSLVLRRLVAYLMRHGVKEFLLRVLKKKSLTSLNSLFTKMGDPTKRVLIAG